MEHFEEDTAWRILEDTANTGTLNTNPEFSDEINSRICELQPALKTAYEISPEAHVLMQAAWQKYIDLSVSKCLIKGSLLETDKGLIRIEDFSTNRVPDTFEDVSGYKTSEGHNILRHYYGGKKPVTKVRLDDGAEIIGATNSHRVLTPNGWVMLSDLHYGDLVFGKLVESHGVGGMEILWENSFKANAKKILPPVKMSPRLALFLGMLCADGGLFESAGKVGFTNTKKKILDIFDALCIELFDVKPVWEKDRRNSVYNVYITSRNLVRFLKSIIGYRFNNKHAPTQILQGSKEEKLAFLNGLTLDGYITGGSLVIYEGRSKQLADDVFSLCQSFGVPKIYAITKTIHGKYSGKVHGVKVSNKMQALLEPLEDHKNIVAAESQYNVYVGDVDIEEYKIKTSEEHYSSWRKLHQGGLDYISGFVADDLGVPWKYLVHKVTSVEPAGVAEVFDVEVENNHQYIVNGIVSHNTINLPNEATVEDILGVIYLAWKVGSKGITIYRDASRSEQILEKPKN
jgi:ribonucleoside-diphosphate reductase alpha chain